MDLIKFFFSSHFNFPSPINRPDPALVLRPRVHPVHGPAQSAHRLARPRAGRPAPAGGVDGLRPVRLPPGRPALHHHKRFGSIPTQKKNKHKEVSIYGSKSNYKNK